MKAVLSHSIRGKQAANGKANVFGQHVGNASCLHPVGEEVEIIGDWITNLDRRMIRVRFQNGEESMAFAEDLNLD